MPNLKMNLKQFVYVLWSPFSHPQSECFSESLLCSPVTSVLALLRLLHLWTAFICSPYLRLVPCYGISVSFQAATPFLSKIPSCLLSDLDLGFSLWWFWHFRKQPKLRSYTALTDCLDYQNW